MKKIVPAYILSFIISFMLFVYEPICMYSNNINDFWFDFNKMFIPMMIIFLGVGIVLSAIYTVIYVISKKIFKSELIYEIILIGTYILFILLYIQGNYLAGKLPGLDGSKIVWSHYKNENIISGIIFIIIVISYIVAIKKFNRKKVINVSKYISLGIFAMLSTALISTMLTKDTFHKKNILVTTNKNINVVSNDKNFVILLLDAVDSRMFNDVLEKSKYKDTFEDFTYYPDTMSTYGFTRESIPFILSGVWNENKTNYLTYYDNALDKSVLFKKLNEKKYNLNIYEEEFFWTSNKAKKISNARPASKKINIVQFFKQEIKYVSYKYLPYFLKKYSSIETMSFSDSINNPKSDNFSWKDKTFYDIINNEKVIKKDNKYFKFIHLEGAHVDFDLDEDLNSITNGTYEQKLAANIKLVDTYLNKLKENDAYDNSVIIILSDHGYIFNSFYGRQNPILYIKGIDEHHEMYTSDKPISYEDLNDAYLGLLNGKSGEEIFEDIPDERERRYLWYEFFKEDHMVEYMQSGKAWDLDTMKKTGKEFNR